MCTCIVFSSAVNLILPISDEFGQPDALEYHMNVESHLRQSRFLEVSIISLMDII